MFVMEKTNSKGFIQIPNAARIWVKQYGYSCGGNNLQWSRVLYSQAYHGHIFWQYLQSLSAMLKSANCCIPRARNKCGRKFGWDSDLKELNGDARKNYWCWRDAGRPPEGRLYCAIPELRKVLRTNWRTGSKQENDLFCSSSIKTWLRNAMNPFRRSWKLGYKVSRLSNLCGSEKQSLNTNSWTYRIYILDK